MFFLCITRGSAAPVEIDEVGDEAGNGVTVTFVDGFRASWSCFTTAAFHRRFPDAVTCGGFGFQHVYVPHRYFTDVTL